MSTTHDAGQIRRRLGIVRWVALVDLILLIALVSSSLTGQRELVRVLGPLHGINFLMLIAVAATAALDGLWGWWFPAAILLTAGPPGALVGEWLIVRRITAPAPARAGETAGAPGESMPGDPAAPPAVTERRADGGEGR